MFILKKGHQPGVYVPLRALFLVSYNMLCLCKRIDVGYKMRGGGQNIMAIIY